MQFNTVFNHLSTSLSKSYQPILKVSSYSLLQITYIQNYLQKIVSLRENNCKKAFEVLYKNYYRTKKNPWFKKSAEILALNTKVNSQKSFWRMKYNIYSSGILYNSALIIKLKKLFNNVRKYY